MRTYKEPKRIDKPRSGIVNPVEYVNRVAASLQKTGNTVGDSEVELEKTLNKDFSNSQLSTNNHINEVEKNGDDKSKNKKPGNSKTTSSETENGDLETKDMEDSVIELLNSLPNTNSNQKVPPKSDNHALNAGNNISENGSQDTVTCETLGPIVLGGLMDSKLVEPVVKIRKLKKSGAEKNATKSNRKRVAEKNSKCNKKSDTNCDNGIELKHSPTSPKKQKSNNEKPVKVKTIVSKKPKAIKKPIKKKETKGGNSKKSSPSSAEKESPRSDHSNSPRTSNRTPKKNRKYQSEDAEGKENSDSGNKKSPKSLEKFTKKRKLLFEEDEEGDVVKTTDNEKEDVVEETSDSSPVNKGKKRKIAKKTEIKTKLTKKKSPTKNKEVSEEHGDKIEEPEVTGDVIKTEEENDDVDQEKSSKVPLVQGDTTESQVGKVDVKKKKSIKKSKLSKKAQALINVDETTATAIKETMDYLLKEVIKLQKKGKKVVKKKPVNKNIMSEECSSNAMISSDTNPNGKGVDEKLTDDEMQVDSKPVVKKDPVTIICQHCGHISHSKGANTRHLRKCVVSILKGDMLPLSPTRAATNSILQDSSGSVELDPDKIAAEEKSLILQKLDPELKKVESTENGGGHYRCQHCSYATPKRAMLARHMRTHGIYVCLRCNFICDSHDGLKDHCHQDHKERTDFKLCRKCSRYVKCENTSVEQHMEECQGPVPYICPHCNKEFKYESSLKSHVIRHNPDAPKRFKCEMCSYESNYKANLKKHMTNIHGDKVKNVPCVHTECDKMFYTDDSMRRHLKWHSEERPFRCDTCQKRFKTNTALKGHEVIHDPARPFKCNVDDCTKDFRSKKHLKNHHAEFHNMTEKTFKCTHEACTFAFFKRSHLQRHLMTHSGTILKCDLILYRGFNLNLRAHT